MKKAIYTVALGLLASGALAQVSLNGANPTYSQDFNTLITSGTAADNTLPTGWEFIEAGTGANNTYAAGDGSSNAGNMYSFGTGTNTDRALGALLSGSVKSIFGVKFINNTGNTISQADVTFYGEQWRLGVASASEADKLLFKYAVNATSLDTTNGTWISVPALTFTGPITSGTAGALDGNASANRALVTGTITGLNIPAGATFYFSWTDYDRPSSDDGLAIDDLSIQFTTGSIVGPVDTFARFAATTQSVNENAGTATVNLIQGPVNAAGANYSVDVVLKSGNAADIDNYTTQTVNFTAGNPTASFTFNVTDNAIQDGDKTVTFALRNPSQGLLIGTDSILTVTIIDNEVPPLPLYTIATVRGANTDGQPDSLGVNCRVKGIVYGVNLRTSGIQFYIHDGTAGMAVFNPSDNFGYTVSEGDSIIVTGEVGTFRGLAQMTFVTDIELIGSGTIPAPAITNTLLDESTEGELIRINGLNLVSISDWNAGNAGGNSFSINATNGNGTYNIRIERNTTAFNLAAPVPFFDIIGIGSQYATTSSAPFLDGYQVIPRYDSDIIINTSNEEVSKDAVKVFPNPSAGEFNMVAFVNNAGEYSMSIIDMTGKTVFAKNLNLTAGNNLIVEDLSALKAGVYHVRVLGAKGAISTQFVVK